jgi:hypothetical protein
VIEFADDFRPPMLAKSGEFLREIYFFHLAKG